MVRPTINEESDCIRKKNFAQPHARLKAMGEVDIDSRPDI
jgi:hypothetical protein